jgi:hypothetical protein
VDHPPNFYDEASLSEACCPVFENSIGFVSYSEQHDEVFVFVLDFDWLGGTSSAGLELKKPVGGPSYTIRRCRYWRLAYRLPSTPSPRRRPDADLDSFRSHASRQRYMASPIGDCP